MSSRHGLFNQKLSVGPTLLMCSAPSTPMTSSSDWSASSNSSQPSFPDSRIIFTQSASKQGWSKDDFGNVPVSDSTALANEVTPPDKRLVQAAARPTSHNNTIAPHTGFLTQALQSASADRCLDIIKALQGPFYHKLFSQIVFIVFDNVTSEEYNTLSLLVSEDHRYRFSAKLVYHPDLSQLVVMVPYEIHELAMNNFSQRVRDLLQPDGDFKVVPDFRLSLRSMHNHGGQALIPWWVGECGFSSTVTTMLRQLGAATEMAPEMDLALMISIREKKRKPPPYGHALQTSPKLHRSDFDHTTSVVTLDPVVVGGVSWVKSVFPNMQMDTVNQLLNLATKWLFLKITSMMEEVQANHAKIRPLQQASTMASFPCEWSSLLCAAFHSLSDTAYKRYCKWYNQPPPVNNSNDPPPGGPGGSGGPGGPGPGGLGPGGPGVPGPSRKRPSTPEPGPSSKRPTSHHSSSRGQQGKSHKRHHSGKKANRK
ncbi:hypothetical protein PAXINDRAFT_15342 [Paxillus involutus ATCC 200175]|uniref:Uncharacterized protein n=1 Tax=Paxillus involutus ATCC 200175 TaxID=664439 RepID=A0A0C9ST31_PAXIN|nr:hypothetical protein PAXINDRAFT_15342 [Paxillus involutus ATCC 200175]